MNEANQRRKRGEVKVWPPNGFTLATVRCLCGFAGPVYFSDGHPPAMLSCPANGCDEIILIPGGGDNPMTVSR